MAENDHMTLFMSLLTQYLIAFTHIDCQFMLENAPNGVIMSPGFPHGYRNGWDCTWLIKVQHGQVIATNFLSFDIHMAFIGFQQFFW